MTAETETDNLDYAPDERDTDCDHCSIRADGCDLVCCIEANGCEPWATKAPSAKVIHTPGGYRRTYQIIHECGRTWRSQTVEYSTTASPLQGGKTYWTFERAYVVAELAGYPLHATGVCERCTQAWRQATEKVAA